MLKNYTQNEQKLFLALGFGHLMAVIENPPALYRMAVETHFIENNQGPAIEALRRGFGALSACKPYRCTSDFEKLIEFKGDNDESIK